MSHILRCDGFYLFWLDKTRFNRYFQTVYRQNDEIRSVNNENSEQFMTFFVVATRWHYIQSLFSIPMFVLCNWLNWVQWTKSETSERDVGTVNADLTESCQLLGLALFKILCQSASVRLVQIKSLSASKIVLTWTLPKHYTSIIKPAWIWCDAWV